MIKLRFDIDPVAKGRPRLGRGNIYTPQKTAAFERELRQILWLTYRDGVLEGPLDVTICFFIPRGKIKREFPSVKPDLDNFVKAVFDAFNGIVWKDDGQVVAVHACKQYCDDPEASTGSIHVAIRGAEIINWQICQAGAYK